MLSVHVFSVQLGLQTLSGQLTDILLPSSVKPVLKGFTGAAKALSLILFITVFRLLPDFSYSFWLMAACLLLACPLLYIGTTTKH